MIVGSDTTADMFIMVLVVPVAFVLESILARGS